MLSPRSITTNCYKNMALLKSNLEKRLMKSKSLTQNREALLQEIAKSQSILFLIFRLELLMANWNFPLTEEMLLPFTFQKIIKRCCKPIRILVINRMLKKMPYSSSNKNKFFLIVY